LLLKNISTAHNKKQALPTRAAIFFDLTNQFNSVSREEFKNVIATSFPELLPLVTLFYDKPNTVHFKWDDGSWRRLSMKEGTSQGCPLSPLFASFVVARLLAPLDSLLRARAAARLASGDEGDDGFGGISHLLSYVDDISSCVYLPNLKFLCQELQSRGARLGCFVNRFKTRILTSCNGTSILPLLSSRNQALATSLSDTIAQFFVTPHPTDTTAPPVPVELTSGCRLLGHPVGLAAFATEFFSSRIAAVSVILPPYTTISATFRPASVFFPNAHSRNSPIFSPATSYITSPSTKAHPHGRIGLALLPPPPTASSTTSLPPSLTSHPSLSTRHSSAKSASVTVVSGYYVPAPAPLPTSLSL
jgi:hypothetical protein